MAATPHSGPRAGSAPGPRAASGSRRVLSVVGPALVLSLALTGCGGDSPSADPDPGTEQAQTPPDRELDAPSPVAGAQLPVWADSARCQEPRPAPEPDGLVIPAPVPDAEGAPFYVPAPELELCTLPGVQSASVGGIAAQTGSGRDGEADLGILLDAAATAGQLDQAWRTGAQEAQSALAETGIDLDDVTLLLDDGSQVTGPAVADPAAPGAADTATALAVLDGLRASSPVQEPATGEDDEPAADPSATAGPSAAARAEAASAPRRWTVAADDGLVVTTVIASKAAEPGARILLSRALELSAAQGQGAAQQRTDRVRLVDDRLELTLTAGQPELLTPEVMADLSELGRVPDARTRATVVAGAQGPVLRVRIEPILDYKDPDEHAALEQLEDSAAEAGLRLDARQLKRPL